MSIEDAGKAAAALDVGCWREPADRSEGEVPLLAHWRFPVVVVEDFVMLMPPLAILDIHVWDEHRHRGADKQNCETRQLAWLHSEHGTEM